MGISPQIAAMSLRQKGEDPDQDPAKKEQEDPKMIVKRVEPPKAFQRLRRNG